MARPMRRETVLKLRSQISSRRPAFKRQEHWRLKRVGESWRRPHGIDNPMAHHFNGFPPVVKVGYRGPASVRGLHPSGMRDILIHTEKELAGLSPRQDAVRIAADVSERRRRAIVERAQHLGLWVLNKPKGATT